MVETRHKRSPPFPLPDQVWRHDGLNSIYAIASIAKRLCRLKEDKAVVPLVLYLMRHNYIEWPDVIFDGLEIAQVVELMEAASSYSKTSGWKHSFGVEKLPKLFDKPLRNKGSPAPFWESIRPLLPVEQGDSVILVRTMLPWDHWLPVFYVSALCDGRISTLDPYKYVQTGFRRAFTLDPEYHLDRSITTKKAVIDPENCYLFRLT